MLDRRTQQRLEKELDMLKAKLALNVSLIVIWQPDSAKAMDGEVVGKTIYIYEPDDENAINVLRHEVVDYCLTSRIIHPLVDLVNLLIKVRADDVYREKERLVDALVNLMS